MARGGGRGERTEGVGQGERGGERVGRIGRRGRGQGG